MNLVYLTLLLLTAFGPPEAVLPKAQETLPSPLSLHLLDSFETVSKLPCSKILALARADLTSGQTAEGVRMLGFRPELLEQLPQGDSRFFTLLVSEQELQAARGGRQQLTWPGYVVVYRSDAAANATNPPDDPTLEIDSPKGILYCNEDRPPQALKLKSPRLVLARSLGANELIADGCDHTCRSNTVVDDLSRVRTMLSLILRQGDPHSPMPRDLPAIGSEGTQTARIH